MKKLILIACVLFAMQTLSAQNVEIKYNLQPGREYTSTESSKLTTKQVVMGMTMSMDMHTNSEISYRVRSFSDGVFELEVRYNRIGMEIASAYVNMKMDSADGAADDIMSQVFRSMIGKPFSIKMTTSGKINGIEGLDEMLAAVVAELPYSEAERAQVKEQLESSYGKEVFVRSFEQAMAIYPSNAVTKGEKWSRASVTSNNGINLNMVTEYEYAGLKDGYWIIMGKSTMSSPKDAKMHNQGMEMDVAMSGATESEIKVDPATGWIITSTQIGDIVGTVSAEVPMQGRMDIDMNMSLSATVSGTVKK